jgi:hypothetical protein
MGSLICMPLAQSLKKSQKPLHFYLRILAPQNFHMQGGLQISIDAGYPWLPEGVIQGLPRSVGCNTQMGAEIGRESKAQDTLCLLIGLVPSRNGIQVSLGGGNHRGWPDCGARDMPEQPHGSQKISHCLLPGAEVGTGKDWDIVDTVVGRHCGLKFFCKTENPISSLSVTVMDHLVDQKAPVHQTGFYALCGALDHHTKRAATGKVVERTTTR